MFTINKLHVDGMIKVYMRLVHISKTIHTYKATTYLNKLIDDIQTITDIPDTTQMIITNELNKIYLLILAKRFQDATINLNNLANYVKKQFINNQILGKRISNSINAYDLGTLDILPLCIRVSIMQRSNVIH